RLADIVFVGLDEARVLWGSERPEEVRALLPGVAELVVKDAERGATAFMGDAVRTVPAPPVEVTEAVGAGDAFAAGYLAARLGGSDPEARLRVGHLSARRVLQSSSDTSPFPSLGDLLAEADRFDSYFPTAKG
ncbi:PfkB family carbohydrate kinase, partial [Microbacterium sp.]|uniref:PfkB family carbohydrate kinase n=1 Tax=Microbacterium sp. TaxID=51671 RepID=UPI0039E720FB